MCRVYDELTEMKHRIDKEGPILKTTTGKLKVNPLYKQERKLYNKFWRYLKKFGLTPLSSAKKGLPSPEETGLE